MDFNPSFAIVTQSLHNLVISTKEKSPQVTPQRKPNLCRASHEDFSFVEMTRLWLHCERWIKIHPYNIFCSSGTLLKLGFIIEIEMTRFVVTP
jgi:hypothetical protein